MSLCLKAGNQLLEITPIAYRMQTICNDANFIFLNALGSRDKYAVFYKFFKIIPKQ